MRANQPSFSLYIGRTEYTIIFPLWVQQNTHRACGALHRHRDPQSRTAHERTHNRPEPACKHSRHARTLVHTQMRAIAAVSTDSARHAIMHAVASYKGMQGSAGPRSASGRYRPIRPERPSAVPLVPGSVTPGEWQYRVRVHACTIAQCLRNATRFAKQSRRGACRHWAGRRA